MTVSVLRGTAFQLGRQGRIRIAHFQLTTPLSSNYDASNAKYTTKERRLYSKMDKIKDMASKVTGGSSGGSSTGTSGSTGGATGGKEDKYISQGELRCWNCMLLSND